MQNYHKLNVDAAESIVYNIVEGAGASTQKEFARFLTISIRSSTETEAQLEFAHDARALSAAVWAPLGREVVEIRRMLCGLRAAVLRADDNR